MTSACPHCGGEDTVHDGVCRACGKSTVSEVSPKGDPKQERKSVRGCLLIFAGIFVAPAFSVGGCLAAAQGHAKNEAEVSLFLAVILIGFWIGMALGVILVIAGLIANPHPIRYLITRVFKSGRMGNR